MQFIEKLLLLLAMLMYTKGVFCRHEIYKRLMIVMGNYLFILINILYKSQNKVYEFIAWFGGGSKLKPACRLGPSGREYLLIELKRTTKM